MTSRQQRRSLEEATVDTVREPLIVLDDASRVVAASRSFYRAFVTWALAVLGKRQSCVRMHEAGPYQRLKRTEPIAPVSTAAR